MFIILAILSAFGYALQYALMTKFARKWDSLSMAVYRSLSLGISMLPLLMFSREGNIALIYRYQPELILSSFCIVFNVWALFESYKYLPLWVASGMRSIGAVLTTIIISLLVFNEKFSLVVGLFVLCMLVGWFILSAFRNNFNHLDNSKFLKWLGFVLMSSILSAISLVVVAKVSRDLDPFVSSYFWEMEAGMLWLIVLFFRQKVSEKRIEKISLKDFSKILLASSPTLVGTMCFALACLYWPVWLVSSVWVLGIFFSVVFGVILFQEHLRNLQYVWIILIAVGIVWVKMWM